MADSREISNGTSPLEKAREDKMLGKRVNIDRAREDTIVGLGAAIKATKKRLEENGSNPEVEFHLKNLEERLEKLRK